MGKAEDPSLALKTLLQRVSYGGLINYRVNICRDRLFYLISYIMRKRNKKGERADGEILDNSLRHSFQTRAMQIKFLSCMVLPI